MDDDDNISVTGGDNDDVIKAIGNHPNFVLIEENNDYVYMIADVVMILL